MDMGGLTDFGFKQLPFGEKSRRVREIFRRAAPSYDLMNDVMSLGVHRVWKRFATTLVAARPWHRVLDLACGSGDMAKLIAPKIGPEGSVCLADPSEEMLAIARERLDPDVTAVRCEAESLPFPARSFDRVVVAFGYRNFTHKERTLDEITRVLAPGGKCLILEFSEAHGSIRPAYHAYLDHVIPCLGKLIADDEDGYRYLSESIQRHPSQAQVARDMTDAGLDNVRWHNLSGGVAAIHTGTKRP